MRLLSAQEIVYIHDRLIQASGGSLGLRESGLLVAIAEKAEASFGGVALYATIFDKSAAVFEAVCNYHVFVDGNKRTALVCLEYILSVNGFKLIASANEREDFVLMTATTHPDLEDVAIWIENHSRKETK